MATYSFVTPEDMQPFIQEVSALRKQVSLLLMLVDEWVSTDKAMQITGMARRTIENERERPNTLIKYKKEGRKVAYNLQSLIAYNERKRICVTRELLKSA
jgi:hypothetical protein